MSEKLTLEILSEAVKNAAAFRCVTEYQPIGGPGDKVFPPTYLGGVYATETRLIDGHRVPCVLLDSVQSQANRMELALLQAWRDKRINIPVITVDFSGNELQEVGRNFRITSLDAPHRIADAILRDSVAVVDGNSVPFGESEYARRWGNSRPHNATELFRLCPTALLFGIWGSPEKPGGLGTKFARAIVSEIMAIDVEFGVKTSSRIDPLGIPSNAATIYSNGAGAWTLNLNEAQRDGKGNPLVFGNGKNKGKPSAINHGNIPPTFTHYGDNAEGPDPMGANGIQVEYAIRSTSGDIMSHYLSRSAPPTARKGQIAPGGITMSKAIQTTVLSLSALRRLEFPILDDDAKPEQNLAARTALAALGICAATLARTDGDLRSRCQLHPFKTSQWEIVAGVGEVPLAYDLSSDDAVALLKSAAEAASTAGIPWQTEEIKLKPSANLIELVKRSQEVAGEGNTEDSSEA
jgi:CRISPR-associated protein Csb1